MSRATSRSAAYTPKTPHMASAPVRSRRSRAMPSSSTSSRRRSRASRRRARLGGQLDVGLASAPARRLGERVLEARRSRRRGRATGAAPPSRGSGSARPPRRGSPRARSRAARRRPAASGPARAARPERGRRSRRPASAGSSGRRSRCRATRCPETTGIPSASAACAMPSIACASSYAISGFSGLPKLRQSVSPIGSPPAHATLRAAPSTACDAGRERIALAGPRALERDGEAAQSTAAAAARRRRGRAGARCASRRAGRTARRPTSCRRGSPRSAAARPRARPRVGLALLDLVARALVGEQPRRDRADDLVAVQSARSSPCSVTSPIGVQAAPSARTPRAPRRASAAGRPRPSAPATPRS